MPWNCEVPLQHGKLLTDGSGGVVEIPPEAAGESCCFHEASGFDHIRKSMFDWAACCNRFCILDVFAFLGKKW